MKQINKRIIGMAIGIGTVVALGILIDSNKDKKIKRVRNPDDESKDYHMSYDRSIVPSSDY